MDPVRRFSSRVQAYVRYRPSYPPQVLQFLETECGLNIYTQVADLGSGTRDPLPPVPRLRLRGHRRRAQPRHARRRRPAARRLSPLLASTDAPNPPASPITLSISPPPASLSTGSAPPPRAANSAASSARLVGLRSMNERLATGDPFLEGYEQLLQRYAPEYQEVDHRRVDTPALNAFFEHRNWRKTEFDNAQSFDLEGVRGRLDSSSYAPPSGTGEYVALIRDVSDLFHQHHHNGRIAFRYRTNVYIGTL